VVASIILFALVSSFAAKNVAAQEKQSEDPPAKQVVIEPSEAQMALNDDGVRAMIEGDYAAAVSLLERSVRLGKVNVTYLNLGRAYQKLGRCAKARAALEKARTAPAVADPPPAEVRSVAEDYLAELAKSCEDETALAAEGDGDGDSSETSATGEETVVDPSTSPNILGWTTTISGVALVGGGVALHFVAESERAEVTDQSGTVVGVTQREAAEIESSADRYDTIGLAMGVGGGVLAAVGTYLLLTDDAGTEQDSTQGAAVWMGAGEAGVSWTQHF
jgi:hypothetical protein